jgi:hypothetical protein
MVAREIAFIELSPGLFGPAPTQAQKRAERRRAKADREKRQRLVNTLGFVVLWATVIAFISICDMIAFGGGIGPNSVFGKLVAWL